MLKAAAAVLLLIFLTGVVGISPALAGTVADPLNDLLFPGANAPDIIGLSGAVNGSNLRVSVEFKPGTFQQPPGAGTTGVGIYLDTDLNPATGGRGISGGGVDFQTIGWEFLAVLEGTSSGVFRYVGPQNNNVTLSGIALSTFTADGFSMTIPLLSIGPNATTPDDGRLTLKAASFRYVGIPGGPTSGIYDVAPNIGLPAVGVFHGDYNDDSTVSAADYDLWAADFRMGMPVPSGTGADGNGDGLINAADYVIWRNNLGDAPPGSASVVTVTIPEPTAAGLALLTCFGMICGGRCRTAFRRADD